MTAKKIGELPESILDSLVNVKEEMLERHGAEAVALFEKNFKGVVVKDGRVVGVRGDIPAKDEVLDRIQFEANPLTEFQKVRHYFLCWLIGSGVKFDDEVADFLTEQFLAARAKQKNPGLSAEEIAAAQAPERVEATFEQLTGISPASAGTYVRDIVMEYEDSGEGLRWVDFNHLRNILLDRLNLRSKQDSVVITDMLTNKAIEQGSIEIENRRIVVRRSPGEPGYNAMVEALRGIR